MELNSNKLFLTNIYFYDIESCHYNILKKINYNTSSIYINDKEKRNIQIGLLQKKNSNLIFLMRTITTSMINEYLLRNNIKNESIICRQYDGIILDTPLKNTTNLYMELPLKNIFDYFIISNNKNYYIALDKNKEIIIKGINNYSNEIKELYIKLLNINFLNKTSIFKSLEAIKKEILESDNKNLYLMKDKHNNHSVFIKDYGEVEVSKNLFNLLDINDIDKKLYYNYFLEPFIKSIVLHFI